MVERDFEATFAGIMGEELTAGSFPMSPKQIGILEGGMCIQEGVSVSRDFTDTAYEPLLRRDDFRTGLLRGVYMRVTTFSDEQRARLEELHV
jgi:hypothetical protein